MTTTTLHCPTLRAAVIELNNPRQVLQIQGNVGSSSITKPRSCGYKCGVSLPDKFVAEVTPARTVGQVWIAKAANTKNPTCQGEPVGEPKALIGSPLIVEDARLSKSAGRLDRTTGICGCQRGTDRGTRGVDRFPPHL